MIWVWGVYRWVRASIARLWHNSRLRHGLVAPSPVLVLEFAAPADQIACPCNKAARPRHWKMIRFRNTLAPPGPPFWVFFLDSSFDNFFEKLAFRSGHPSKTEIRKLHVFGMPSFRKQWKSTWRLHERPKIGFSSFATNDVFSTFKTWKFSSRLHESSIFVISQFTKLRCPVLVDFSNLSFSHEKTHFFFSGGATNAKRMGSAGTYKFSSQNMTPKWTQNRLKMDQKWAPNSSESMQSWRIVCNATQLRSSVQVSSILENCQFANSSPQLSSISFSSAQLSSVQLTD